MMKGTARLMRNRAWLPAALLLVGVRGLPARSYQGTGLVLKVSPERNEMLVSMQEIPGYMDAMVMPLQVQQPRALRALLPGMMVEFTLIVNRDSAYAENIRVRPFESVENDPLGACRLTILEKTLAGNNSAARTLAVGERVPNFALFDQSGQRIALSKFAGQVVVVDFVYTRCPFPNFCFRLSDNLAQVQKRFAGQLGRDLALLTVTLDVEHDHPEELAKYAGIWKANDAYWHFLTGQELEVRKVAGMFGIGYWQDEGLMTHSLHTVIIDRQGNLAANLEGNLFSARQLGDLVESVLNRTAGPPESQAADLSNGEPLSEKSGRPQE